MKVLQICNKPPFPLSDGGAIAMAGMINAMVDNGYDVTVLTMVSFKHTTSTTAIPQSLRGKINYHSIAVDLRIKPIDAFLNLFTSKSYHVERFIADEVSQKITALLEETAFDIIQMETVFIAPYLALIRKLSKAKVIMRMHNVEFEVWERTAKREKNLLKSTYLNLLASRLKTYELRVLNKLDGIITISSDDQKKLRQFGCIIPTENIPLGVNLKDYPVSSIENGNELPMLFHLGAMDWIPNQQAIDWFLKKVWPILLVKYPKLKFHIAGRKMPAIFFKQASKNLLVKGEVDSAREFMQSKDIMVVPVLSGSGLRIKIIEGMALGKAVVSTTIGASGIAYQDGKQILIGDSAAGFAEKIIELIDSKEARKIIGKEARLLAEEKYSLKAVARQLDVFYSSILLA